MRVGTHPYEIVRTRGFLLRSYDLESERRESTPRSRTPVGSQATPHPRIKRLGNQRCVSKHEMRRAIGNMCVLIFEGCGELFKKFPTYNIKIYKNVRRRNS